MQFWMRLTCPALPKEIDALEILAANELEAEWEKIRLERITQSP